MPDKLDSLPPRLFTVRNFAERHSAAFTAASLRDLIFRRATNGLQESGAILRLGRKILLDEEKFMAYLVSQQTPQRAKAARKPEARAAA